MAKRKRHHSQSKDNQVRSFRVRPQNSPEVIDYHMTSQDGKNWSKHPGSIMVMIVGSKSEDSDETIAALIDPLTKLSQEKRNSHLFEKLNDYRHKLYAVRYHLNTLNKGIAERVKAFEKNYNAVSGAALELENPRLVYETEAFLFQAKSSLDLLAQTLGCVIPPLGSVHSFKSKKISGIEQAGGSVINALHKNGFEELGNLFELHRINWIQELVDMRDTITHYSRLRNFHCFIEEPYIGESQVAIHYPTMPSGARVDTYSQSTYDNLLGLFRSALGFVKLE